MNRLAKISYSHNLRRLRVRSTVNGTKDRPRLSVHISNRHVSAQLIDDQAGKTLIAATTVNQASVSGTHIELCEWVGTEIAKKAAQLKIKRAVLDRNGRRYQKRLQALAEAARKNGLEF